MKAHLQPGEYVFNAKDSREHRGFSRGFGEGFHASINGVDRTEDVIAHIEAADPDA